MAGGRWGGGMGRMMVRWVNEKVIVGELDISLFGLDSLLPWSTPLALARLPSPLTGLLSRLFPDYEF